MRCRCCDEPIEGTAFCRTCYDRANYQPDAGEINAALLDACQRFASAINALRHEFDTKYPALAEAWILARAAIAQATEHKTPLEGEE